MLHLVEAKRRQVAAAWILLMMHALLLLNTVYIILFSISRDEFGNFVIDNFVRQVPGRPRTPNPCVLCNTHIKWEALLRRADMLDCEFIATGIMPR